MAMGSTAKSREACSRDSALTMGRQISSKELERESWNHAYLLSSSVQAQAKALRSYAASEESPWL